MYNCNAIFTLFTVHRRAANAWALLTSTDIRNYVNVTLIIFIFIFFINNRNSSSHAAHVGAQTTASTPVPTSNKLECIEWIGRLPNKAKHGEHNAIKPRSRVRYELVQRSYRCRTLPLFFEYLQVRSVASVRKAREGHGRRASRSVLTFYTLKSRRHGWGYATAETPTR